MEQVKGGLLGVVAIFFAIIVAIFFAVASCASDEEAARANCNGTGPSVAPGTPGRSSGVSKPMRTGSYQISRGYGAAVDPFTGADTSHLGLDMAGPDGTPIYSYAPGVVTQAGPASGFGQWIVIDHNIDGKIVSTVYGHMWDATKYVHAGDQVGAGQQIAEVGSNGGSTGPHLHFEYWIGGHRDTHGGTSTDPAPFVDAAPEPGSEPTQQTATPAPRPPADLAASVSTAALPPLPASVGSEAHFQIATIRVARAVLARFPQIQTIGGWRESDPYDDHPSGRAADIMIPDYASGDGVALGNAINDYILNNAATFQIEYTIWRQTYHPADGEPNMMEDRGSDTANHYDHVHVTTVASGFPHGSEAYVAPPGGTRPSRSGKAKCPTISNNDVGGGVDNLAAGQVPPEYEPWLRRAGTMCPQISSALLAGDQKQESQFNKNAVSSAGAQGPAQFMPGTWPSYGRDEDGNGQASAFDIGDATMAQARYFCDNARTIDAAIAAGTVHPDANGAVGLYVAAYNAGVGAVLSAGGMPSGGDYTTQTAPYVSNVLAYARQFQAQGL